MLRKQGSQQSSTALSGDCVILNKIIPIIELARGLSLDVGLGLKPWESRSIAEVESYDFHLIAFRMDYLQSSSLAIVTIILMSHPSHLDHRAVYHLILDGRRSQKLLS